MRVHTLALVVVCMIAASCSSQTKDVRRSLRLVDNLLTYAKLNDARRCYRFESTDLGQLAEEALERCHVRLSQGGYHVNFDPGPAPLRVLGDSSALGLVLDNLLDNAIKYSPPASCLTVEIHAQGSRALVRISDEGDGIREDERSSVFEKFVRGRLARAPGKGLGLAIVLRVITDHHGQVELRPGPSRGTVVEIVLPCLT